MILLGEVSGDVVFVEEFYIPEGQRQFATEFSVGTDPNAFRQWWYDAYEAAREAGLDIVGDMHSHPFRPHHSPDASPSEVDWDSSFRGAVQGIVAVQKLASGRFRCYTKWWPARAELECVTV